VNGFRTREDRHRRHVRSPARAKGRESSCPIYYPGRAIFHSSRPLDLSSPPPCSQSIFNRACAPRAISINFPPRPDPPPSPLNETAAKNFSDALSSSRGKEAREKEREREREEGNFLVVIIGRCCYKLPLSQRDCATHPVNSLLTRLSIPANSQKIYDSRRRRVARNLCYLSCLVFAGARDLP